MWRLQKLDSQEVSEGAQQHGRYLPSMPYLSIIYLYLSLFPPLPPSILDSKNSTLCMLNFHFHMGGKLILNYYMKCIF